MRLNGFIPLWRTLLDWEWIDDPVILSVWVQCLLRASFRDSTWRGMEIKRGQLFTSSESLAKSCGVSRQQVRRALEKLQKSENLTSESTSQGLLITVCKYEAYNALEDETNQQINQPPTSVQPAFNQPSTSVQPHLNNENKETRKQQKQIHPDFDQFWANYPRREGKPKALQSWNREKPDIEIVLNALAWQKKKWTDPKYIPLPATYLNQRRFEDERPKEKSIADSWTSVTQYSLKNL